MFEHLLRRSHSHNDTQQSDSSCGADSAQRRVYAASHSDRRSHISDRLLKEKLAELSLSESHDEPEYVYTHSLARQLTTKSVTSASSRGSTHCVHACASAVSSPKLPPRTCQTPPTSHASDTPTHLRAPTAQHDDVSSSSTEDYEYTDPNELRRRKKKSFLQRQKERLMHIIRRRSSHPLDFEVESQDSAAPHKYKKKKRARMTSSCRHLPSREPLRMPGMVRDDSMQQEVLRTAASSPDHVTHYTDIEVFAEESERRVRVELSREDSHVSEREKSRFGSLLRSIKRKSSFKLKRSKESPAKGSICKTISHTPTVSI